MDSAEQGIDLPILARNCEQLVSSGHFSIALVPLRKLLHLDPNNWKARHLFIRCCLAEGGPDLMVEAAEELSLILLQRSET